GAVLVAVPFSLPPTSFTPNYHRPLFLQCEKQKEEQKNREPRLGTTTTLLASFTNFPGFPQNTTSPRIKHLCFQLKV
ncbi:unnamed protein product, partial [Prunus brigantina]